MKITHVCLVGGYTEGLNYQENNIIKYQAADGHKVSLITTDHCYIEGVWGLCPTEKDYINPDGVRIIRLPFAFPLPYNVNRQIGIFKGFKEVLEELEPDVIFVHNLQFQDNRKVASYKKRHPGVKVYADNHSDFFNSARNWFARNTLYRFWWKPCARAIEPYVEKFFGVTPGRVEFLQNIFGISKEKTDLLVMGADDAYVKYAEKPEIRRKTRGQFGIQKDDFLIVTGGKYDILKTQVLGLMKAVKQIPKSGVKLLVFGSVSEDIKGEVLSLCDGKKIQYAGWANAKQSYEYFAAANLVVFPGGHSVYWEQTVAQGIPLICKYWEGMAHIDIGGNVEFLTESLVEEIEEKIVSLIENPKKYAKMKECAMSSRRHTFSYKIISRKAAGIEE